jgi:hypothetical protein
LLARKGWCKVSDVDGGETDPAALRALVPGLLALKDKAGGESYARAASILVARIRLESDPFVLRNLVSSLHALADQIEESGFNEAASSLTARLIDAKSAVDVQALARSVAVIEPNVGEDSAAELGSKLVDRVKVERDPGVAARLWCGAGISAGRLPQRRTHR